MTCTKVAEHNLFMPIPRVLIADARSFQALAAILDYVTQLASISCWYRSDPRQDEFRLSQAALLWISKVRCYDHVCRRSAKKTCKYQLSSNKTHGTHFSNLWLLVVLLFLHTGVRTSRETSGMLSVPFLIIIMCNVAYSEFINIIQFRILKFYNS